MIYLTTPCEDLAEKIAQNPCAGLTLTLSTQPTSATVIFLGNLGMLLDITRLFLFFFLVFIFLTLFQFYFFVVVDYFTFYCPFFLPLSRFLFITLSVFFFPTLSNHRRRRSQAQKHLLFAALVYRDPALAMFSIVSYHTYVADYNLDEEGAKAKLFQGMDTPATGLLGFFIVRSRDSLLQTLGYAFVLFF